MSDQTQPIPSPLNAAPVPTPGSKRGLVVALAAAGGLLLGCCGGFGVATTVAPEPKTISSPSPYAVTSYVTVAPSAPADAPTSAKPAAVVIEDGVWLVGVDFPAGTYRTTEAVSNCYWGVYKAGTNQADILDNDIVDGGRPTVVLKKGQEFKSSRCGTWTKVK